MNVLITAGGTTENIDPVRKIKNTATGRLGSLIAEEFVKQGKDQINNIFYLCEQGTIIPNLPCLKLISASGVSETERTLTKLLTDYKIDAVIHSMAVSDYTVDSVTTANNLAAFISQKLFSNKGEEFTTEKSLAEFITACIKENNRLLDNQKKLSSNIDNLMIFMKQTPKLLGIIKNLQPSTILVGFKLLSGVDKQYLIDIGYELLQKNDCDFVIANDSRDINMDHHIAYLISPDKSYIQFQTKEEIAQGIVRKILSMADEKVGEL